MRTGYAAQYGTPSVILEPGDTDPDAMVEMAEEIGAIYWSDDRYLVVRISEDRGDEVYTEEALRRSFRRTAPTS